MKHLDEKRNCTIHGHILFKHRHNRKGEWWVCSLCLKEQWRRAAEKRRKDPKVRKYQSDFNKELNLIRRHLSVYLTIILIAANLKPE